MKNLTKLFVAFIAVPYAIILMVFSVLLLVTGFLCIAADPVFDIAKLQKWYSAIPRLNGVRIPLMNFAR